MRLRVAALAAVVLFSGCGQDPPPDAATSRGLVAKVVLDFNRAKAAGDGKAGCRLLTRTQQAALLRSGRRLAATDATRSPHTCVEAVTLMGVSAAAPEILLHTQVAAVRVSGERATATARTSALMGGLRAQLPGANIALRWADGHWLIDRRAACRWGITAAELLDRIHDEVRERKQAAQAACTT